MNKKSLITILFIFLAGCAGSPVRISMLSPQELKAENAWNLCGAYAHGHSEKVKAELVRRGEIPDDEWPLIEQNKIRIGMSEFGLVCSWGGAYRINETVGSWGVHKQWVYRACRSCSAQYVYTENGKVSSWQN